MPHSGPPSPAPRSIELAESGRSHLLRFVQLMTLIVALLRDFAAVPQMTSVAIGLWQGRNHHNFNEHSRSPKVGREASPRRRVCRIDPLVPNRVVIFEQAHVSDPDLGA